MQENIDEQKNIEEQVKLNGKEKVEEQEIPIVEGSIEEQENIKEQKNKRKKILFGVSVSLCSLLAIYFGMAMYFTIHFCFGSEINGSNVSLKSVDEVKEQMISYLQSYKLTIKERDGKSEQISGSEIGLKYISDDAIDTFKDNQNPLAWVSVAWGSGDSNISIGISYDEKLLKEKVNKLYCVSSNVIEPKIPSFKYTDNGYVIVDEVNGNKVNKDILYKRISDAVLKRQYELDLDTAGCYVKPQYTSKSQKVLDVRDMLNKYVSSKITYIFENAETVLDGSVINKWIKIDENLAVTLDEQKIKSYLTSISNNYAKTCKITNFTTSSGKTININGGDYNWMINTTKEVQYLNSAIKEGKTTTREPVYIQKNAFVEIDLTKQHIWFYKNGTLVVQGDIVSGNTGLHRGTPAGIYSLKYKKRNAVLRGPGYAAPVKYWMPFVNGIGIHDASWRKKFGGTIYKTDGSHGCVNCPYSVAKKIFENIEAGTPVICYY